MSVEDHYESCKNDHKCEIEYGEQSDIMTAFVLILVGVFPEGDQTGKGCNQSAHTADIDTQQQLPIVFCKLGQQDGRRHIADNLAGNDAENQGTFTQQPGEYFSYDIHTGHISGEDEEEHEGKQQGIVHHFQRFSVHEQQDCGNHHQTNAIGDSTEHDGNGKGEQQQVNDGLANRDSHGLVRQFHGFRLNENDAAKSDQQHCHHERRRHDGHKLQGRDFKLGIQIEILGVAERGQHTAQVGCDVLHNEGEGHVIALSRGGQNKQTERQEGQQSHVIGNEHGTDKGDVNQSQDGHAGIAEYLDDFSCQHIEEVDILQCADHCQHTEQAGKGLYIEIAQICFIGRDQKAGDQGCSHGDEHDNILFDKTGKIFPVKTVHKLTPFAKLFLL